MHRNTTGADNASDRVRQRSVDVGLDGSESCAWGGTNTLKRGIDKLDEPSFEVDACFGHLLSDVQIIINWLQTGMFKIRLWEKVFTLKIMIVEVYKFCAAPNNGEGKRGMSRSYHCFTNSKMENATGTVACAVLEPKYCWYLGISNCYRFQG